MMKLVSNNVRNVALAMVMALLGSSCYYDQEEYLYGTSDCGPAEISYQSEVSPIIEQNCSLSGCHGDVQGPILTNVSVVQDYASQILVRIQNGTMPPAGPLSQEEIDVISCWVDQGAKDN